MANRTDPTAATVHGTNPQNLVEKILRLKIYDSTYWKEHCFGLTAETLVDKALSLRYLGGTYGGMRKPTEFMCLLLKMLQIQPDKEIVVEYIKNDDYKYVRLLGALYLRLVGKPLEVYRYLEPLYNDYRKIRLRTAEGVFVLSHVDEVVDDLLTKDYLFDIAMPRIPNRLTLEKSGQLEARVSVLDEDFDELALEEEAGRAAQQAQQLEAEVLREKEEQQRRAARRSRSRSRERRQSRSRSRERDARAPRERERDGDRRDREVRDREVRDRDVRDRDVREREPRGRDRDHREERRDRDYERRDARDDERKRRRSRSRDRDDRRRDDKKDKRKRKEEVDVDPEIAEANALRAKLGLKPLK